MIVKSKTIGYKAGAKGMAKEVSRVNGKAGESMMIDNNVVSFRSGGTTHTMELGRIKVMEVRNAEEAKAFVNEAPNDSVGLWAYNGCKSAGGKCLYIVGRDTEQRWAMEVNKSQANNALAFCNRVIPKTKEEQEEDIKLYAAIQTPLGGLAAIGEIVCILGSYFATVNFQQPLLGLILAGLAIFLFFKAK